MGLSRALAHHVQVKWRQSEHGVYVRVQVDDHDGYEREPELKDACLAVMKAIFERAEDIKSEGSQEKRTTYGTAKWAQMSDLDRAGYVTADNDPLRLVLGLTDSHEPVSISAEDSVRHGIVVGPTGSGKTSRIIIPQMLRRWQASAIVTEATAGDEPPDVFHKTSGFRNSMGSHVYYFNPDDLYVHQNQSDRSNNHG